MNRRGVEFRQIRTDIEEQTKAARRICTPLPAIRKIMNPEAFIKSYETALGTQDWKLVEPLVSENIAVVFSNGTIHIGKENVQKAFERNFSLIKNEKYAVENIKWLAKDKEHAVYLFEFSWTGIIDGKSVSGNGIGTSVLVKEDARWKLLTEHLGRKPK